MFGQADNHLHPDGLSAMYQYLASQGISIADIDRMAKVNPAKLLGVKQLFTPRETDVLRWVLVVLALLGLLDGYLPACTDRKELLTIDGETIRWFGVVLFASGGTLRLWPVYVLGHRFSGLVAIQPEHTLVTDGIYNVIRHPSYLGLLVNSLGWGLAFRSGVGVLLTMALIPPLLARIRAEEALLGEQFGEEYRAYCARTSRLIPGLYQLTTLLAHLRTAPAAKGS